MQYIVNLGVTIYPKILNSLGKFYKCVLGSLVAVLTYILNTFLHHTEYKKYENHNVSSYKNNTSPRLYMYEDFNDTMMLRYAS